MDEDNSDLDDIRDRIYTEHKDEIDKALQASNDKIEYLDSLPMIGPITKYHLARNLGIDCAKPDRHLVKLAKYFGYPSVQQMCEDISKESGYRIGTVDVILWRYCNMHHPIVNSLFQHSSS